MANLETNLNEKMNTVFRPIIQAVSDNRIELDKLGRKMQAFVSRMADMELTLSQSLAKDNK